ncbi:MAG: hypothetical protein FWB91_12820, partial [Defluviitaleaceae bacterium]|nr:hypothetical protein [Defluviitaleaceae bacterium]
NPYLELLSIGVNNLAQIDVSNNRYLSMLSVWDNQLTALDVSGKENLQLLSAQNNRMTSHNDVIGWQEIGLILNDTFIFYPQGVLPVGLALEAEWEWELWLDIPFEAFAFGLDDPSLHFTAEGFTGAG